jgi:hypothetical protein
MIQAYVSGDCYLEFAKLAGAVPAPITKDNVIAHPLQLSNQEVSGLNRIVSAAPIAARGLRPWRRPVETMEQRSA